jgi:hypothetical protein
VSWGIHSLSSCRRMLQGMWGRFKEFLKRHEWARQLVACLLALHGLVAWIGGWGTIVAFLAVGATTSWAMISGISLPIAVMGGVCMLAGSVFLALVPAILRRLRIPAQSGGPPQSNAMPDYDVWRHIENLTLTNAASLWCELDPNVNHSDSGRIKHQARLNLMRDAVKQRDLALQPGTFSEHDKRWPTEYAYTTRTALQAWAQKKGFSLPPFLKNPD